MAVARWFHVKVVVLGEKQPEAPGSTGGMRCLVPGGSFWEALESLRRFLGERGILLRDVQRCYCLDPGDRKRAVIPENSPLWENVCTVVRNNWIYWWDVDFQDSEALGLPERHARYFIAEAQILEEVVPGAKGKLGYRAYALPLMEFDDSIRALARCAEEDGMRLEDIALMRPLRDFQRSARRHMGRIVGKGEVWRGPVFMEASELKENTIIIHILEREEANGNRGQA